MSVCICKVIKVAVQLRSKWKLIRSILNWFGVYSNSKPEFLLLVVKLDKCFMVKPFKSTHKGTPKFGQIFEKFHFRIINDSLYGDVSWSESWSREKCLLQVLFKLFEGHLCIHFSKEMVIFELFMILYRIIMIMLRSIDFCVFGLFEVIKFRCSNTTDLWNFYIHDFHEFQEG